MGQASDDVKKAATDVTTSCEEEGFANAVEKFILNVIYQELTFKLGVNLMPNSNRVKEILSWYGSDNPANVV